MFDTVPGGAIHVRGPTSGLWTDGREWRLVEDLRIGRVEGEGADVFGEIKAVTTDQFGRIYVVDRLAKQVKLFDASGIHLRNLGRQGEGPGEFANPWGLAWDSSGRLWVLDVQLNRFSVFDTSGSHIRDYRRLLRGWSSPWGGRFTMEGVLYDPSFRADSAPPLIAFQLDSASESLVATDTFPAALRGTNRREYLDLRDQSGVGPILSMPFGRRTVWAFTPEGLLWVGFNGDYRLALRNLDGDTVLLIERDIAPEMVSADERTKALEPIHEWRAHPRMDLSLIPTSKPSFEALIPDDQGHLWVLREGLRSAFIFEVFDGAGRFMGALPIPVRPEINPPPHIRGDAVVIVTKDSLGIPFVLRYRVEKGK